MKVVRLISSKPQGGNNRCNGCVRCCVEPGIEVPKAGENGEPLAEPRVKLPGESCPWIGPVEGGVLGCIIYDHPHRPEVCIAYVCEELLSPDSGKQTP